jgi:hypothetical protein
MFIFCHSDRYSATKDNLGGPTSFEPVCAFNDGYDLHEEVVNKTNSTGSYKIETAAFKMNFVFVTQKSWSEPNLFDVGNGRRLTCKGQNKLEKCCGANAYQGLTAIEMQERKDWCKEKGCSKSECPVNRRRGFRQLSNEEAQDIRSLQQIETGSFTGTNFTVVLGQYTSLEPIETGAVLDATGLKDVTECRTNNYNVKRNESATLSCKKWEEKSCDDNDYIYIKKTNASESQDFEGLAERPCPPKHLQECCSEDAFNGLFCAEKKEKEKYCKDIGCLKNCPNRS